MSTKTYFMVSGMVFGAVAVLHALRLALGWTAVIGNWSMPMWFSGLGLVIAGFLAYTAFSLSKTSV